MSVTALLLSLQIASQGSQVKINNRSYPKDQIQFDYVKNQIVVRNGAKTLAIIKSNTEVAQPTSTSMSDLYTKLTELK